MTDDIVQIVYSKVTRVWVFIEFIEAFVSVLIAIAAYKYWGANLIASVGIAIVLMFAWRLFFSNELYDRLWAHFYRKEQWNQFRR